MRVVPPIRQRQSTGVAMIFAGGAKEGFMQAIFTDDLSEAWQDHRSFGPFDRFDSAWVPLEGPFFIEATTERETLFLRGLIAATNTGPTQLEHSVRIRIPRGAKVVYLGALTWVRAPERKLVCRNEIAAARRAASKLGYGYLLDEPWQVSLAEP